MEIGIIVPVYNCEVYLKRCMESLLRQTHKEIKIFLIDDGSTDKSGSICDDYQKKDDRIMVIHKKNEGQSIARNIGIHLCESPYLMFMDSDDILPKQAIERLKEPLKDKEYDIICGTYQWVKNNHIQTVRFPFEEGEWNKKEKNRKRYHQFKTESIFGYVWGKLYKTSFLREHNLVFDDIRKVFMEDNLFNLKACLYQPRYYIKCQIVYQYYIHQNTSSNRKIEDIQIRMKSTIESYIHELMRTKTLNKNMDMLIPLIARTFCWTLIHNTRYEKRNFSKMKNQVKSFSSDPMIHWILEKKHSISMLCFLPSIPQRIFYRYCLELLRRKQDTILAGTFFILYPLLRWYIKLTLNH